MKNGELCRTVVSLIEYPGRKEFSPRAVFFNALVFEDPVCSWRKYLKKSYIRVR